MTIQETRLDAIVAWPLAVLLFVILSPFMLWAVLNERRWARQWARDLSKNR